MRIRITFSKQGALRYTGHLDLHTLLERAARRAALPLAYSQGFHPTPKIQLASALPLGFSSRAEVMDMWLTTDCALPQVHADLQAALPHDIQILDIQQVDDRSPALQTQLIAAEYEATIPKEYASNLTSRLAALSEAESLPRERRGKAYDLRPLIESLTLTPNPSPEIREREAEGGVRVFMRLTARDGATGRPEEVLSVLEIPPESVRVERTRLIFQG
ncbi:MAG: TIGR03936 family radical SAM-associated protein [Chloroflexota bacterium]